MGTLGGVERTATGTRRFHSLDSPYVCKEDNSYLSVCFLRIGRRRTDDVVPAGKDTAPSQLTVAVAQAEVEEFQGLAANY